jgi:hypothetical protein
MGEPAACRDRDTEPRLRELGPGHLVACHFPLSGTSTAAVVH